MAGLMDLYNGTERRQRIYDAAYQRGQQSRLAKLTGQAWNTPQEQQGPLLAQIASIDPQVAAGFEQRNRVGQKSQQEEALNLARAWKSTANADPAQREAFYNTWLRPRAQRAGLPLPDAYNPQVFDMEAEALLAMGGGQGGSSVQSTYVDAQGNRVAILRDGSTAVLGQNAPNNQIIDTGNGFYGVNRGNLQAAPVMVGGAPQSPASGYYQTPQGVVRIGEDLSPEQRQAAMADISAGGNASEVMLPPQNVAPGPGGQLLRSAPGQITPYQQAQLDMQRDRLTAAQDARDRASAAAKDAASAKETAKQQAASAKQIEAATAANQLISAIDTLTNSSGFSELGTALGDIKLKAPLIRSDVKDSQAQLKNIAGQVALATMSRLKALSSQGATGFGALSQQELRLLENSIATLQSEDISNKQLSDSLSTIRAAMEKTAAWQPQPVAASPGPAASSGWSIQRVN